MDFISPQKCVSISKGYHGIHLENPEETLEIHFVITNFNVVVKIKLVLQGKMFVFRKQILCAPKEREREWGGG